MRTQIVRVFSLLIWSTSFCVQAEPANGADDLTFEGQLLLNLHNAYSMEISAGQLAMTRGTSVAIRQFGSDLVKDLRVADAQILALAAKRNVSVTPDVDGEHLRSLASLTGDAFDHAFVLMTLDDHTKTLAMLKLGQARINNDAVRALLETLRPTLENQRDTAATLSKGS